MKKLIKQVLIFLVNSYDIIFYIEEDEILTFWI